MPEKFEYVIADKKYIQKPLVLGQIRQLVKLLNGVIMPEDIDTAGIVALLGDKLPLAIAIVLTPEGTALKDKNIEALASEIEFDVDPETAMQVIEDFFDCNPIRSLLVKLNQVAVRIGKKMDQKTG